MKAIVKMFAFFATMAGVLSCNQIERSELQMNESDDLLISTKSFGQKDPILTVYVETNDVNPLNAGDYTMPDGTSFIDIVELFAANIHKDGNGNPTLYLNDKLTNVLENGGAATYVAPLQAKGIKVLLTILGDWQGIGVANMTDAQSTQFAAILA